MRMTIALRTALLALPFLFAACSVGPDYVTPSAPVPVSDYKDASDWKPAQPKDDEIRGKWWEIYHDPQLNSLEGQVNISNQNVIQAEAQFRDGPSVFRQPGKCPLVLPGNARPGLLQPARP